MQFNKLIEAFLLAVFLSSSAFAEPAKADELWLIKEYQRTYAEDLKKAKNGDSVAQFKIADRYHKGYGLPKNYAEAVKWYRRAAENEEPFFMAHLQLGYMYAKGNGVRKDYKEAVRWYREAANWGEPYAQYNLGVMHRDGTGVSRSYTDAYKWFSLAAAQGSEQARINLDWVEARMAPDQISKAQKLAADYRPGRGVERKPFSFLP